MVGSVFIVLAVGICLEVVSWAAVGSGWSVVVVVVVVVGVGIDPEVDEAVVACLRTRCR